jgi:hypothetical protein
MDLVTAIYRATSNFPKEEQFGSHVPGQTRRRFNSEQYCGGTGTLVRKGIPNISWGSRAVH